LSEAESRLNEAYKLALQSKETWTAVAALNALGGIAHIKGELEHAIEVFNTAIDIGNTSPVTGYRFPN
jgi:hypothetical protein